MANRKLSLVFVISGALAALKRDSGYLVFIRIRNLEFPGYRNA